MTTYLSQTLMVGQPLCFGEGEEGEAHAWLREAVRRPKWDTTTVNLSGCRIDVSVLAEALAAGGFPEMRDLQLDGSGLGEAAMRVLGEALETMGRSSRLRSLHLAYNPFGTRGLRHLVGARRAGAFARLWELWIAHCNLEELPAAVCLIPSLKKLDVEGNRLHRPPQNSFYTYAWEKNLLVAKRFFNEQHGLVEGGSEDVVFLRFGGSADLDVRALAEALRGGQYPALRRLELDGCGLDADDLRTLFGALEAGGCRLHALLLNDNPDLGSFEPPPGPLLSELQELGVARCGLTTVLPPREALPALRKLRVAGNALREPPQELFVHPDAHYEEATAAVYVRYHREHKSPSSSSSSSSSSTSSLAQLSRAEAADVLSIRLSSSSSACLRDITEQRFPNLEELWVEDCGLTELPAEVCLLPQLQRLRVAGNALKKPPQRLFHGHDEVESAAIARQFYDGVQHQSVLGSLAGVESLELCGAGLGPEELRLLVAEGAQLRRLWLDDNPGLGSRFAWPAGTRLEELSLRNCGLTELALSGAAASLTKLDVRGNALRSPPQCLFEAAAGEREGAQALARYYRELLRGAILLPQVRGGIVGSGLASSACLEACGNVVPWAPGIPAHGGDALVLVAEDDPDKVDGWLREVQARVPGAVVIVLSSSFSASGVLQEISDGLLQAEAEVEAVKLLGVVRTLRELKEAVAMAVMLPDFEHARVVKPLSWGLVHNFLLLVRDGEAVVESMRVNEGATAVSQLEWTVVEGRVRHACVSFSWAMRRAEDRLGVDNDAFRDAVAWLGSSSAAPGVMGVEEDDLLFLAPASPGPSVVVEEEEEEGAEEEGLRPGDVQLGRVLQVPGNSVPATGLALELGRWSPVPVVRGCVVRCDLEDPAWDGGGLGAEGPPRSLLRLSVRAPLLRLARAWAALDWVENRAVAALAAFPGLPPPRRWAQCGRCLSSPAAAAVLQYTLPLRAPAQWCARCGCEVGQLLGPPPPPPPSPSPSSSSSPLPRSSPRGGSPLSSPRSSPRSPRGLASPRALTRGLGSPRSLSRSPALRQRDVVNVKAAAAELGWVLPGRSVS